MALAFRDTVYMCNVSSTFVCRWKWDFSNAKKDVI